MAIDLVWHMPNEQLDIAPWRRTSREKFIKGIISRDRREMHLEHMPIYFFAKNNASEDAEPPPFEADPCLTAEAFPAVNERNYPAIF
jgi:hypothetical protein